ncbi:MAG: type 1 glutamine amidotransferase [Gemmatimonadota bacterium]
MLDDSLRFLLLQVRNQEDPMRHHEVSSFARSFSVPERSIEVFDLLGGAPSSRVLVEADVVLLGGSGDYSVARGGPWLQGALDAMVTLFETRKPTFASCWGFQAMARALGGEVVTDHARAEVGSVTLELTRAGETDPVFGPLGRRFQVQIGHEDIVTALPPQATLLASSDRVENEAYRLEDAPIYATQFHPEIDRQGLIDRLKAYPSYIRLAGAETLEELEEITPETPHTVGILTRFLELALGATR